MEHQVVDEIIAFWLGSSLENPETAYARRQWWYKGPASVDDEIRARFGTYIELACGGGLAEWEDTADGAFALILLLDQFTRNIYRNTPGAYLGDTRAFDIVNRVIDRGLDRELHLVARIWLYHPFHHAEDLTQQDRGLALLHDVLDGASEDWHVYIRRSIKGWTRHRNIVARFGRFPHRNAVLGRENTDEERVFLGTDGEAFGQGPK